MALLIEANQVIEEYADTIVQNIIVKKDFEVLAYPPNNGLTAQEKKELAKLDDNDHLKNALRKIIADNSAGVVFNLFNLIDGTSSPREMENEWTGVKLIDEQPEEDEAPFSEMLHDGLFGAYWEWQKLREDKGWKLDTYGD